MDQTPPLQPFKSISYAGAVAGTRLIVTGAVHGNEVCGTQAIRQLAQEIDDGSVTVARGRLTLVPVCNPLAHALGRRHGDRNLNRALGPVAAPRDFEDTAANWLCPLLADHDVLLDLHSFQGDGRAFVMVGPHDNDSDIEPFAGAAREEALARCLGVDRAVDGWLGTYARGVERRRAAAGDAADRLDLNPRYGIGTTEYMRSQGGIALTLECGQHADPMAPEVAWRAIRNVLAHLRITDGVPPADVTDIEALSLTDVVDKVDAADAFARPWKSFDRLAAGDTIGTRADGRAVVAPIDGWIVFPNAAAGPRQEWFYLAQASRRF